MAADLLHFTLILVVTTMMVMVLRTLRQPAIIGYILAGLLVGPALLSWTEQAAFLDTFGSLGIALLLFLVGISLDLRAIRSVGVVSLVTGVGQVLFTSSLGYLLARAFGFAPLTSLYVAVALTFSSTIIIVKLLTDKKDLDSLYGRIAVGFLVVQDLIAVLAMILITTLTETGGAEISGALLMLAAKTTAVILLAWGAHVYVLRPLLREAGKDQEVLFLFSITLCFALAVLFAVIGLSLEIGALAAGLLLASTPYSHEIASRVKPLRDFFIILFFIALGAQMQISALNALIWPALALSAFVLIGNPLIVMVLMGLMGFGKRTAFLAGLTVAQISEFSLILVSLGLAKGHMTQEVVAMVTMVGLVTILGSSYMIMYSDQLFKRVARHIPYYRRGVHRHERKGGHHEKRHNVILFGCDRIGTSVAEHLRKNKKSFLVVDFNPETVLRLQQQGTPAIFGDADDAEIYDELRIEAASLIISTILDVNTNLLLISMVRKRNPDAKVIVTANHPDEALELYEKGADYVIIPHMVGGSHASGMVELLFTDIAGFADKRTSHLNDLRKRR